jgi:hypothetical protein
MGRFALRLFAVACVAGAIALAFAWGFLASEIEAPPHERVERLYEWSRQFPRVQRLYRALRTGPPADMPALGLWRKTAATATGPTREQVEEMQRLEALGYLAGYEAAPAKIGVTRHDPARAWQGLNLLISGHEPAAVLMDMDGNVVHRWSLSFAEAFPDRADAPVQSSMGFWRRVLLLPGGELLAIFDNLGMIKLDRDSRLLWANPCRCHHDLDVAPDGRIYTVANRAEVVPRLHPYEPVLLDFLVVLDANGKVEREVPLLEAFEKSFYVPALRRGPPFGDVFHTNTVTWLDGRHEAVLPAFRRGNVLLSLRELSTIAVLDPERQEIVWAASDQWLKQHEPVLVPEGRMLIFDNKGGAEGRSRVLEFDPRTRAVSWSYAGSAQEPFDSATGGSVQRLPNGNTLITESDGGRALEVTAAGEIVWEYYNPARAGEKNDLIANLSEMTRIERASVAEWLPAAGPEGATAASVR